ncbi:MAG: MBL fold metallo-hydrolase [Mediterranea sp.]|jgi:L-ascorbate metabolism protein UlaG (beta-lactamase superfamily)|nr:MBL fold metallo-hydrolase [Mediterranea sp.]
MRLSYIYHSGFALEAEGVTVIIDYYKDSSEADSSRGIVNDRLLGNAGPLYVLSTHFHPDHFNPEVLGWRDRRQARETRYIFSRDILKHRRAKLGDATYIRKGERYADDRLIVEAFGSTDVGSSFLIKLDGMNIFHAGDLNNWHWSEESTPEEIRKAEGDYLAELDYIRRHVDDPIHLAMFPVDQRMGRGYMKGAAQFVDRFRPALFAPMHFGEDYEGGNAMRGYVEGAGGRFLTIAHRGESFELNPLESKKKSIKYIT